MIQGCLAPLLEMLWIGELPVLHAAGGVQASSVHGEREGNDQEVKQEAGTERGRNGISS